MKFKCVEDREEVGCFVSSLEKIEGLTRDRVYIGSLVMAGSSGNYIEIVVFNDDNKWESYNPEHFEPVGD